MKEKYLKSAMIIVALIIAFLFAMNGRYEYIHFGGGAFRIDNWLGGCDIVRPSM